jgi:nitrite reductase/ring-hydroxylating ferredoxin subunit
VITKKPSAKRTQRRRPGEKIKERVLCRLDDINDGGSKEIAMNESNLVTLCMVRQDDAVHAYVNSCPHTGAPLNWSADKFLSRDGTMIQCGLHGALFRIADGRCIWGPCLHQSLIPVPVAVRDGDVLLLEEDKISAIR